MGKKHQTTDNWKWIIEHCKLHFDSEIHARATLEFGAASILFILLSTYCIVLFYHIINYQIWYIIINSLFAISGGMQVRVPTPSCHFAGNRAATAAMLLTTMGRGCRRFRTASLKPSKSMRPQHSTFQPVGNLVVAPTRGRQYNDFTNLCWRL